MIGTKRKASISEDDTALLLQRYNATTVLALLQEVSQFADAKIDWDALVKRTSTGISNAREYQMLWRHLAYHDPLVENLENGAEPLDDDSDLEFELEPSLVSSETSSEAATAVKVLMSHGRANDSGPPHRLIVDTTLSLNSANNHTTRNPPENAHLAHKSEGLAGKQPLQAASSSDGVDGSGATHPNYPPRRKRKFWTTEEDKALVEAVKKYGEGNWANIPKGEFLHDRTAPQLSQRWAILKKREAALNSIGSGNLIPSLSEAQLAAQAVSIALDSHKMRSLSATGHVNLPLAPGSTPGPYAAPVQRQSSSQKPRSTQKKNLPSAPVTCSLQEVAVAAGARIATPSAAASLTAQLKHAVNSKQVGPRSVGPRPSNFHYIQTSSAISTISRPASGSRKTAASGQCMPANRAAQLGNPAAHVVPGSSEDALAAAEKNLGSSSGDFDSSVLQKTASDLKVIDGADTSPTASGQTPAEKQADLSVTEVDDDQQTAARLSPRHGEEEILGKYEKESVTVEAVLQTGKVRDSMQPLSKSMGVAKQERDKRQL